MLSVCPTPSYHGHIQMNQDFLDKEIYLTDDRQALPSTAMSSPASYPRSGAGKTSVSLEGGSPSLSLPSTLHDYSSDSEDDLHGTDSHSQEDTPKQTPYFSYTAQLHPYLQPTPSPWDRQCECGGISPHYHNPGSLSLHDIDTMNGTHPPTGPRVETMSSTTAPISPATASPSSNIPPKRPGRLTNHVQVAKTYVFEQQIQKSLRDNGVSQAREDNIRLAGVQWIDNVRRVLKL